MFKDNSSVGGDCGAIYSGSGTVKFNSYIEAENNEASINSGVEFTKSIVINDDCYFRNNKAVQFGGAGVYVWHHFVYFSFNKRYCIYKQYGRWY
ncbi:MAG: hypothetical protein LBS81_05030 [Endomicrobium sp.]|nr:hypothetical protein [Endomicrobium sp.]